VTYGEAHTERKMSMRMVKGKWIATPLRQHKDQMSRDQASEYYTKKLRELYKSQGKKITRPRKRRPIEPTLIDFDGNVDDLYGYYEAQKILKQERLRRELK
jgi:hypothetical protein